MTEFALEQLSQSFGATLALDRVSINVDRGAVGLLGVNGAGKTTLLSAAAGARKPSSGTVRVDGVDLYGNVGRSLRGRVALVPQHLEIPPRLTALEAVTHLTWMRGVSWREAHLRARDALEQVNLRTRSGERVRSLSGGMRRRLALAQALASDADVLLLDEPTTGLDPVQRHEMLELVASLGLTVLVSSHIVEDIEALCDRVVVLHRGSVRFDGSVVELRGLSVDPESDRALESAFVALIRDAA
ncbi:MAG: ABC transporter ATP-binding protein [Demequina sp.]